MRNLGLWGDVSHLLQKQHETVFLVVKSYKVWVSGGGIASFFNAGIQDTWPGNASWHGVQPRHAQTNTSVSGARSS